MEFISILILALAISLDGMVVGVTYGLRKIEIPILSLCIISLTSAISVLVSMVLGKVISTFLSVKLAENLGGLLLVIIGLWILYQSVRTILIDQTLDSDVLIKDNSINDDRPLFKFKIKSLGIVIKILSEPVKADLDYSGVISKVEAVFLGFALALDAFGVGFGAAMTGYAPLLTTISVGISKFICLSLGLYIGAKFDVNKINYKTTLLPGILLIILGVLKFF
ncbi:sporulation membrane protein YtaF [Selenihalanaerobacter shriftii]|uniref:Putative sporulation protein YtaF n=1 Tax=Selenihalanaerobacter shriftii TaxID=142842 RepID=A0A1T4KCM0_9FIRM|nr:sporulation membrane protein YtaF [Selenihalanaerobacter shriftii]SJZ40126.1 putative sporulation protein YtaF [Selenihalanaerobacter shriftii]